MRRRLRERARPALAALLLVLLTSLPRLASACSVCSAGRDDETRSAFLYTTGLLSVLPLGMLGGMVWWLARRSRSLERRAGDQPAGDPLLSRSSSSP